MHLKTQNNENFIKHTDHMCIWFISSSPGTFSVPCKNSQASSAVELLFCVGSPFLFTMVPFSSQAGLSRYFGFLCCFYLEKFRANFSEFVILTFVCCLEELPN